MSRRTSKKKIDYDDEIVDYGNIHDDVKKQKDSDEKGMPMGHVSLVQTNT